MWHSLNSIIFLVKVPVLSEKIYPTYPNSSFKLAEDTLAALSLSKEYINASLLIK
jgi:hypothetical protein